MSQFLFDKFSHELHCTVQYSTSLHTFGKLIYIDRFEMMIYKQHCTKFIDFILFISNSIKIYNLSESQYFKSILHNLEYK